MAVIKEVSATWLTSLYDHLCSSPEIIKNGFCKAGVMDAIQSAPGQVQPQEEEDFLLTWKIEMFIHACNQPVWSSPPNNNQWLPRTSYGVKVENLTTQLTRVYINYNV